MSKKNFSGPIVGGLSPKPPLPTPLVSRGSE